MNGLELLQKISDVDHDLILEPEEGFHQRKKWSIKKWISIAACLCLCLSCSISMLAATGNEFAYEMLYSVLPQIAQKLKPVRMSCTDNGIEMKVVAAEIDGDKATILVSMHDTTGSRIDETADLFDSYRIHTPYDQSAGCTFSGYDADTNTATFLLTMEQMNHELLLGDKITFSVSQLLCGKSHSNFRLAQIKTNHIPIITEYMKNPDIRGRSGSANDCPHLMIPDEANAMKLEEGVTLTGIGVVDDKVHIQLRFDSVSTRDNHGYVYLKDQNGEVLKSDASISFWDNSQTNSYEEFVFSVSADEIREYEIWGEFWTAVNNPIEGKWQVTFPVEKKK